MLPTFCSIILVHKRLIMIFVTNMTRSTMYIEENKIKSGELLNGENVSNMVQIYHIAHDKVMWQVALTP